MLLCSKFFDQFLFIKAGLVLLESLFLVPLKLYFQFYIFRHINITIYFNNSLEECSFSTHNSYNQTKMHRLKLLQN